MQCISCTTVFDGRYCPACGEKVLEQRDRSVLALLGELFENLFEINGKFPRTLRMLLLHPGLLAFDYMAGRRKPHLSPVALLTAGIFLFFLYPTVDGLSASLSSQTSNQFYDGLTSLLVANHLQQSGEAIADLAARYDRLTQNLGSILLFLLVPIVSLPTVLLFHSRERGYVDHLVFSLYYVNFLIWGLFLLLLHCMRLVAFLVPGVSAYSDGIFSIVMLIATVIYVYQGGRRFYGSSRKVRFTKAVLFSLTIPFVIVCYRMLMFFITFYTLVWNT